MQAVKLGYWSLVSRLCDVPNFDTTFPTGIDKFGRIRHGDCTNYLAMLKSVDLPCMSRDTRSCQSIRRERNGLKLLVASDMEGVSSAKPNEKLSMHLFNLKIFQDSPLQITHQNLRFSARYSGSTAYTVGWQDRRWQSRINSRQRGPWWKSTWKAWWHTILVGIS